MHSSAAIALVAALALAGQASARTPPEDGPVSTAPVGGGAPLSTRQQIDQYLASSPEGALSREGVAISDLDDARRIHGEVSLAVGSGGYRGGSLAAVIPLGETATLALSYSKSKGGYGYAGYGFPGYGYDGLSAPLATEVTCGVSRPEPARYGLPLSTGSSPAPTDRCPAR